MFLNLLDLEFIYRIGSHRHPHKRSKMHDSYATDQPKGIELNVPKLPWRV